MDQGSVSFLLTDVINTLEWWQRARTGWLFAVGVEPLGRQLLHLEILTADLMCFHHENQEVMLVQKEVVRRLCEFKEYESRWVNVPLLAGWYWRKQTEDLVGFIGRCEHLRDLVNALPKAPLPPLGSYSKRSRVSVARHKASSVRAAG